MISGDTYITLSNDLGDVYALGNDAIAELSSFSNIVDQLDVKVTRTYDENDLKAAVVSVTKTVNNRHVSLSASLRLTAMSLQKYIVNNAVSVDDFLSDNEIKVTTNFAALSQAVGFPISISNVDL